MPVPTRDEVEARLVGLIKARLGKVFAPPQRKRLVDDAMGVYDRVSAGELEWSDVFGPEVNAETARDVEMDVETAPPRDGLAYLPRALVLAGDDAVKRLLEERSAQRQRDLQNEIQASTARVMEVLRGLLPQLDSMPSDRDLTILGQKVFLYFAGLDGGPTSDTAGVLARLQRTIAIPDDAPVQTLDQALLRALVQTGDSQAATIHAKALQEREEKRAREAERRARREAEQEQAKIAAEQRRALKELEGRVRRNNPQFDAARAQREQNLRAADRELAQENVEKGRSRASRRREEDRDGDDDDDDDEWEPEEGGGEEEDDDEERPPRAKRRSKRAAGKQAKVQEWPDDPRWRKTFGKDGKLRFKALPPQGVKTAASASAELHNVVVEGEPSGTLHKLLITTDRMVQFRPWEPSAENALKATAITDFLCHDGSSMRVFRMRSDLRDAGAPRCALPAAVAPPPPRVTAADLPEGVDEEDEGGAPPGALVDWSDLGADGGDAAGSSTALAAPAAAAALSDPFPDDCQQANEAALIALASSPGPKAVALQYSDGVNRLWLRVDYKAHVTFLEPSEVGDLPRVVAVRRLGAPAALQLDPVPRIRPGAKPAAAMMPEMVLDAFDPEAAKRKRKRRTDAEAAAEQLPMPGEVVTTQHVSDFCGGGGGKMKTTVYVFSEDLERLAADLLPHLTRYNFGSANSVNLADGSSYTATSARYDPKTSDIDPRGVPAIFADTSGSRAGSGKQDRKFDIKYRTYRGTKRVHFSHGRYWDANVANFVCNWLLRQPREVRECNGAGKRMLDMLLPAAIQPSDAGKYIRITKATDSDTEYDVFVGDTPATLQRREVIWGRGAEGADVEGEILLTNRGQKSSALTGVYGEQVFIQRVGTKADAIAISNPFARTMPAFAQVEAELLSLIRGVPTVPMPTLPLPLPAAPENAAAREAEERSPEEERSVAAALVEGEILNSDDDIDPNDLVLDPAAVSQWTGGGGESDGEEEDDGAGALPRWARG